MKNLNRLKFLRIIICVGLLGGIFFSFELWFPFARTFPRVPILIESPIVVDQLLTIILIVSLISIIFFKRAKVFLITAIASLILLIIFDQTRLQPWVYQYLLLLVVITLQADDESNQTFGLAQILIAGLYFWSGVQKLNFTFSHETLPTLLAPLQNFFPTIQIPFVFVGILIALAESFIGCGLLFHKTRNLSVCLAVVMHASILILLIAIDYNSIVWVWNLALAMIVISAFWQSEISIQDTIISRISFAKIVVATSFLLPILSFVGWWDMYLSGALYSGNTEIAVIRINENLLEKLLPKARQVIFQTKSTGEKMLPMFEWSIAELNVPMYPEQRVFKQVAREVCKITTDKNQVELIIKERPAILDGNSKITRISCAELEIH